MSFLTSIMQVTSRQRQLPLDKMSMNTILTEIPEADECHAEAEDGA